MCLSSFAKQNQAEVSKRFQSLLKLLLWIKGVEWVKVLNALGPLCLLQWFLYFPFRVSLRLRAFLFYIMPAHIPFLLFFPIHLTFLNCPYCWEGTGWAIWYFFFASPYKGGNSDDTLFFPVHLYLLTHTVWITLRNLEQGKQQKKDPEKNLDLPSPGTWSSAGELLGWRFWGRPTYMKINLYLWRSSYIVWKFLYGFFLAIQDSSITDIVCLSVPWSQLPIRA